MNSLFELVDPIGPHKVVHLSQPGAGLRAIIVVDNVACGPAIGGTRMARDVTVLECARLARAMTYKNAAAGLANGGAKSVIAADPGMPAPNKEQLMRAFARGIEDLRDYIPGPDMGTDESCMAWVHDEIGRSVGLPRVVGGIPLDEIGATGQGVAVAAEVAQQFCDLSLRNARVAVQGFGAVGRHAASQLVRRGATLVGAADSQGAVVNANGLDVGKLIDIKLEAGRVSAYAPHQAGTQALSRDDIISVDCDVWVPAARPDVLTAENVSQLRAKMVVQGANIPATEQAERLLHERGILCVPDFIANAGGVICAAVEYRGDSEAAAIEAIDRKIRRNTLDVLTLAKERDQMPRTAAIELAKVRVEQAMQLGRWHG